MPLLPPGTPAPDFTLPSGTDGQQLRLSELRGKPVVLVFYPADWSPVCGDQVTLYNEILAEFDAHNAQLLGVSVDGVFCHAAYAKKKGLRFPLLSDFQPRGAVANLYGAFRDADGYSDRALYVIDARGVIRWSFCSPIDVNPGADGVLRALESLSPASA
jgi:peroxiredoxin